MPGGAGASGASVWPLRRGLLRGINGHAADMKAGAGAGNEALQAADVLPSR
jgi:hypothetical protein